MQSIKSKTCEINLNVIDFHSNSSFFILSNSNQNFTNTVTLKLKKYVSYPESAKIKYFFNETICYLNT